MKLTFITEALEAIQNLPISEVNKRQDMLVSLMAELVDGATKQGELTDSDDSLEIQVWWYPLYELTKAAGFEKLGNGYFSAAYSHPMLPGRVIKVGFKKEDSGAAYTAFCRMHQGRAGIPNIYDVQRHEGCYTVVLDELQECDDWSNDVHDTYANIARDVIDFNSDEHNELEGWDAEFVETCKMIHKFFEGIASFDMHTGNIMFDEDDTPYITDPVSFSRKKGENKEFSLEPESLLKEIEEMVEDNRLYKAIRRHARKVERLELRQIKRKRRKANKVAAKLEAIGRLERNSRVMAEQKVLFHMDNHFVLRVRGNMSGKDFMKWEKEVANKIRRLDHKAIVMNEPLQVDKLLDARLMG